MLLVVLLLVAITSALPAIFSREEIFQRGVTAYEERNYELALQSFQHLEEEGVVSAELFYNIGNTYFRLDTLGYAILYYKKGLRIDPANQLLNNNLNYLLSLTQDRQNVEDPNPFLRFINDLVFVLPLNSLFIITLIIFALIILMTNIIIIFYHRKEKTIPLFIITILVIAFALSGYISFYRWQVFNDDRDAVLIASSTTGYSGPAEDYTNIFRIHEGMIFKVNNSSANWSQITLPSGITGWIRNDTFVRVKS